MKYVILMIFLMLHSCSPTREETNFSKERAEDQRIIYANGFELQKINEVEVLTINTPFQGASESLVYYFIPKDNQVPDSLKNKNLIRTPVKEIVVTSTSHIPMLDYLNETKSLKGFPTLDYISSPKMRARIDSGYVEELGRDSQLNLEVLVRLQPELVMTYMLTGDRSQIKRINDADIPVLINADYLEQHPLGRAEWIKVAGLLFNKYERADSIFKEIESNYLDLQKKVADINNKPSVLTGIMYGDTWYLPGGKNYSANLFRDSGLTYIWEDNKENGFLQLSFETVYSKAKNADLWLGVASFNTLEELKNADSRYTWFDAYKNNKVYTYTAKIGVAGGNEYLELGYLRPDIILKDLIIIGHPEVIGDTELYFYKKVQ